VAWVLPGISFYCLEWHLTPIRTSTSAQPCLPSAQLRRPETQLDTLAATDNLAAPEEAHHVKEVGLAALAAHAISVGVEPVRVRLQYLKAPMGYVAAVQVRR
jgi:hypothetical protein